MPADRAGTAARSADRERCGHGIIPPGRIAYPGSVYQQGCLLLRIDRKAGGRPQPRGLRWRGMSSGSAPPHGPLTPLLRYQVNLRSHRYTALTTDGRLIAVVDKSELAARTTEAILHRQLA